MLGKVFFFSSVFIEISGALEKKEVESFRPYKNLYIIKLKGINSIGEAELLAGKEIFVPKNELPPPKEDSFYFHQIFDFKVITEDGEVVGTVKDMIPIPDNDLLVIDKKGKEILIPFNSRVCPVIDMQKREIVIDPPDGLLELDEI